MIEAPLLEAPGLLRCFKSRHRIDLLVLVRSLSLHINIYPGLALGLLLYRILNEELLAHLLRLERVGQL